MGKRENISFDHCIKCTVCSIACPVARATGHFSGPKHAGPDCERLRIKAPSMLDVSLKYCTNCKRCEIACPSGVAIADLIQTAKARAMGKTWRLRDYILSRTDLLGGVATRVSGIINWCTRQFPFKLLLGLLLNIPHQRSFPRYARGTFAKQYRKRKSDSRQFSEQVLYFHGCFVNYNDHRLGADCVNVLNAIGTGVQLSAEKCCGVPLIANGYMAAAKKNARYNIAELDRRSAETAKIVATSTSCLFALKYEYPGLLGLDNTKIIDKLEYITKYLYDRFETERPPMKPLGLRAAYHAPCHLERMGGAWHTIELLKMIPGLDLALLHSECCGIAGTYGFKSEFYDVSQQVGGGLFQLIEQAEPEVVITDCETCRLQIEMNTPYRVLHPVNCIAMALGL